MADLTEVATNFSVSDEAEAGTEIAAESPLNSLNNSRSQSPHDSHRQSARRSGRSMMKTDLSLNYEPTDYTDVSPTFSGSSTPPYMKWAVDLYHLLEDYEGVNLFRQYLLLECCDNMIEFWFACKALKGFSTVAEGDKIQSVGRAIYNKYIRSHGERSLHLLPSTTRVEISKRVVTRKELKASTFDLALCDTERELFIRHAAFVRSDVYIQHVQNMQKNVDGGQKYSHDCSSSSSNSGDNPQPSTSYLPTLHEETEESGAGEFEQSRKESIASMASEKFMSEADGDAAANRVLAGCPSPAGTRSPLSGSLRKRMGGGGGRLTATNLNLKLSSVMSSRNPQPSSITAIMPPNPYHTGYVPFLPGSAQDSELQSLSSDADSMSMTTDSSMDVFPNRSSKKQLQKEQQLKRRSAMANRDSDLSHTIIPRTQRPLSREVLMPPEEFLQLLCEKLKRVQKEQEEREKLNESLRKLSEIDSTSSNASTRRDAVLQYCRTAAVSGEEEHMMILDEHVSRVWESPKHSPLRSPGPGYLHKPSPGSRSPDRSGKLMTNSYPFPQKPANSLTISQLVSSGVFNKTSDSSAGSKTRTHHQRGGKPLTGGPPNPYRIPKTALLDQPSVSGFQPCFSPLADKKFNSQQQGKSKRPAFSDTSGIESGASSVASSSKLPSNSQDRVCQWMLENDKQNRPVVPLASHKLSSSKGLSMEAPPVMKNRGLTVKAVTNESSSAPQTLKRSVTSKKTEVSPPSPGAAVNLCVDSQDYLIVGYNLPNEQVPFLTRFPGRQITLKQFKQLITRKGSYKYYFKCATDILGTGVVFCDVSDDSAVLPLWEGKVWAKVVTAD